MTRNSFVSKLATATATLLITVSAWAQGSMEMATGEVRKVDKATSKITLKHGDIKSLEMPPMTMVFTVRDTALLDKVKVGDKVRFAAERRDGAIVVTAIERAAD